MNNPLSNPDSMGQADWIEDLSSKESGWDYCPTCGSELDTGWECLTCERDWRPCVIADEVQRRMDQVVEAAVEWHQAGREGGEWLDAADRLIDAINSLLELRGDPFKT